MFIILRVAKAVSAMRNGLTRSARLAAITYFSRVAVLFGQE